MSDNEDLLGDDLGDQSLADYNLGNEEEEQLLADDYESGPSQNVPSSISSYDGVVGNIYSGNDVPSQQPIQYHLQPDRGGECVVPNITVEIPNIQPEHSTYAPYEPPVYDPEPRIVPPAIPASPVESPQIVPSDMGPSISNGEMCRSRFVSERPPGAQRQPQVRDIPDSLDKVFVPRGQFGGRGRTSWRSPHFNQRFHHNQYRRNNMHRGNFNQRPSFPPSQPIRQTVPQMRPEIRPSLPPMRPELRPEIIPEIRPNIHPELRPDVHPDLHPELPLIRPDIPLELHEPMVLPPKIPEGLIPERPILPNVPIEPFTPIDIRPNFPRFPNQFRPNMDLHPEFGPNIRPNFEPRPMFPFQRQFRPFIREPVPGPIPSHIPQVTIRQPGPMGGPMTREAEVRMLPVQLPPNLPPGGLQGKKVLINPHFKGNFQSPVEGLPLPTYIPTRIQKSPPLSPTLESKFGPIKDIDDAAERFIAEQRNALARAANRKFQPPPRRSPTRYIENTTIEIENELAPRRRDDDELLRRQEEFINANRAGLRRRMRSASPPPPPWRSPSPPRSPERARPRLEPKRAPAPHPPSGDEDSEYRRRMREQESLRERVLRAKEARRRKNAVANRERERLEKEKEPPVKEEVSALTKSDASPEQPKPDTTRKSPEKEERERSPIRKEEEAEVNSTCENLTPPHSDLPKPESPERDLTPPLPGLTNDSDDDLDLILGDIDGILSDDDDTGRFKEKAKKASPPSAPPADLRSRLPPKASADTKRPKQRITFDDKKKKEKSPARRTIVTSSTKTEEAESKTVKAKEKPVVKETKDTKLRQRITFTKEQAERAGAGPPAPKPFSYRRVVLQRKAPEAQAEPRLAIFSRAVRTALGDAAPPPQPPQHPQHPQTPQTPQVEYDSDSTVDEDRLLGDDPVLAVVTNLPHGMTDTRLKTLAGNDVQNLNLDREERSAKITFKTTVAAENFKKKFNNKMVAASRLTVILR